MFAKVSQTFRTGFDYFSGGAAVTGRVQNDFTIEITKNGTGNQTALESTGITITEVDDTNNAGFYEVEINGATGFVANTGTYELVIYRTATPAHRWAITVRVTANGTGEGTIGAASFTATASDGRVTDGADPIEGATVFLRNSAGTLITSLTTDADGLWGPVYLDESVTIFAQAAGYTQAVGAITVVGSTATGPAADIALSAAAIATGMTASEFWAYARRQARNKSGSMSDQIIRELVNDAVDYLAQSHLWDWYFTYSRAPLELNGSYDTGTVAITDGSANLTLTGGVWPAWAADGEVRLAGKWYAVASRTSDTVIVLSSVWHGADLDGSTYRIYQDSYDLPTNLYRFGKVYHGSVWPWGDEPVSYMELLEYKNASLFASQTPYSHAIHAGNLMLWPAPNEDRLVPFSYYRRADPVMAAGDNIDWDPAHKSLLRRCIDMHVALRYGETAAGMDYKQCEDAFKAALSRAIPNSHKPMRRSSPLGGGRHSRHTRIPDNA